VIPDLDILSDARWLGLHGIGRFAGEVLRRLPPHHQLAAGPRPLSPVDPLWLTAQLLRRRPPVFFSPGFNPPLFSSAPFVFTIHDLIQIQLKSVSTPAKRLFYHWLVKPACHRAYRVLTVSEYSRKQIIEWSGLAEERVVNVGNGVDGPFQPRGPRHEPGFPYILYVGSFRPHKNLDRLFAAFRELNYPDLHLLLVGTPEPAIEARLERLEIRGRTGFVSSVSDDTLASVYRGATLLVLPSLMEGFGLPALEALACGTPVAAARSAALPEVVGDAGLYFDPLDVQDMKRVMERVLSDRDLRTCLRVLGPRRAQRFSWDRVVAKVYAVLQEAAGAGK
jgi:glycosyltransferase involved in cell wall biosynthesis